MKQPAPNQGSPNYRQPRHGRCRDLADGSVAALVKERRWPYRFLGHKRQPGIFDDEARRLGAQVHYVRYGRAHLPRFAKEFRQVLREGQYDAIHDHQDYASGWHFLMGAGRCRRCG